ncbi:MAG: type II toxin-antitoxin system RelE/ParE family toxin [Steroidobacteraceae bacterium]
MNRIVFTQLADDDIDDIWINIAADNEAAADRIVDELHEVTSKLLRFPLMGHAADQLRPGARVFVRRAYLIVYRPMDYGIAVLRIAHGARNLELLDFPPAPEE